MAISLGTLREAANRQRTVLAKSLTEARQLGKTTAFLCHSHLDTKLAEGLQTLLQEAGWRAYIDWQDTSMPATPNRETASKIKGRIKLATFFLFLATPNSMASRWCPWEIGHADGVKPADSIFVVSTRDDQGHYYGNEYLQLYRHIDYSTVGRLCAWHPGETHGVFVESLQKVSP